MASRRRRRLGVYPWSSGYFPPPAAADLALAGSTPIKTGQVNNEPSSHYSSPSTTTPTACMHADLRNWNWMLSFYKERRTPTQWTAGRHLLYLSGCVDKDSNKRFLQSLKSDCIYASNCSYH